MSVRILPTRILVLSPERGPKLVRASDPSKFARQRIRSSIMQVLKANTLCSMATVTPNHHAHINPAYFCCSQDLEIFFLSDPTSLHCRNLESNPSMAMTIFDSSQNWGGSDRGIQLFGTCRQATGRQALQA